MVDHPNWLAHCKGIPVKEATTVANTIFEKLILEHGAPKIFYLTMVKNSQMAL